MRIGVVSDTHGKTDMLRRALDQMGPIDLLIHAGDHFRDAAAIGRERGIQTAAVAGNCDWEQAGPDELELDLAGKKILVTHGHKFGVKTDNRRLAARLKEGRYDLIIYGHSHIPEVTYLPEGCLLNPGSVSDPRRGSRPTYAVVDIDEKGLVPHIKEIK